ncbi:cyclic nucleotide-binding domain-containing protein [Sulfitobacter sp. S0837]|uniref:ABC transporter transmembrane domain-containing protein n=1 Tax=Sulfitobacter maritimus TaxID=2741719 RepID=UPI001582EDCC|nr:ABC transporter transmembrane domain-containing protein [Sulfitobacter maritimus]NUH64073.1 cyclic nucleotide-binding domain-containing protein [Sulfitobacter maritimus]
MDKSLFQFIWKNSKRDQLLLLAITLLTFPLLYISLELPKRIINDAIGGTGADINVLGITLSQVEFLMVLCLAFLLSVLANGLLKMRLNTMKGVLAERLLRRFRFQLLSRMLMFPRPFFRATSQGELVSMVTSEAEPMGGLMGDMLSQPVFQIGQMLTILVFLFAQSVWFGLVSIALIPLQAWIIPKLQRQVSLLNKDRIQEVRKLATEIGETAAGVSDLRRNGGARHRMSLFSTRLGFLFSIRLELYKKKYFMKFLNNFINQLTPFFFYSVGGYLAITGDITVGALVAALAAYKDLSSPWKEVLAYYNQTQDMSLRWEVVTEKFAQKSLVDETLFEGTPDTIPQLDGDIELRDVTVLNENGFPVLEDINLVMPRGARIAIKTRNETAALALADVLTREVVPSRGEVRIAGHPLNELHQTVIANKIGYASSTPYIFQGTIGENLLMPFKNKPVAVEALLDEVAVWQAEAARTGNSTDPFDTDWVEPGFAGLKSSDEIGDWWFRLVEAMGIDDFMVRRALSFCIDPNSQKELADAIVRLRPVIADRLAEAGLNDIVHRFDPAKFSPVSPLGTNLLYALPTRKLPQEALAQEEKFITILRAHGLVDELAQISAGVIEGLTATFGKEDLNHPLFRRLNLSEDLYLRLGDIAAKRREVGDAGLPPADFALLLTLPFAFSAEQIGPTFRDVFRERILKIRRKSAKQMVAELDGLFETIDPSKYFPVMTVLGNAIFGRISILAGAREKQVEDIVVDVLSEHGLKGLIAQSIFDLPTTQGGENLPSMFRERISFSRAGIKKPDVLILQNAMANHDSDMRSRMRERISELLPDATKIFIEKHFSNPEYYDLFVEIEDGRIDGAAREEETLDEDARRDLNRKLRTVAEAELFQGLDRKQQRLLAFSAQWYEAKAGEVIFKSQQKADAAYLCVSGLAGMYLSDSGTSNILVAEIEPGRLIGDLAVIMNEDRTMHLAAIEDSKFLRIGGQELLAVIENDAAVATSLLRAVAGHLMGAEQILRKTRLFAVEHGVDLTELDAQTFEHR